MSKARTKAAAQQRKQVWGPADAGTPPPCPCGTDHTREAYAEAVAPLEAIIECSTEAKHAHDESQWQAAFSRWIGKLIPPAEKLGAKKTSQAGQEGPTFLDTLNEQLAKIFRHEADLQSRSVKVSPRDHDGGIFHGGLRGRVEEAQHQLAEARKNLSELKVTAAEEHNKKAAIARTEKLVRAAYLRVTGGELNKYVRLAELRPELPGVDRSLVDRTLKDMQFRQLAVLYPIDDPQRITKADNEAHLKVSGERRDLFLIRP